MTASLIPQRAAVPHPSYWCTWCNQGQARPTSVALRLADYEGEAGARGCRNNLDQGVLFGPNGWARDWPADVRGDLLLVLDDGWDVPIGVHPPADIWRFGELAPDPGRFPDCAGEPAQRLAALVALARSAGWAGLGIWVACQAPGDGRDGRNLDLPQLEAAWRERLRWSRQAEVAYWKVDWGRRCNDHAARALMTRLAREEAPGLVIEHAWPTGPLNAMEGDGRAFGDARMRENLPRALTYSDVVRAYDVIAQLGTASMLDRLVMLLAGTADHQPLINGEDEVYLAATLGCALGILRSPSWCEVPGLARDPRDGRYRADEAVRALRWLRCAPPVPAGVLPMSTSAELLEESYHFRSGDTWYKPAIGRTMTQRAPAVVARGCPLPQVRPDGAAPFIVAMRHPNGCQALASLPRTRPGRVGQAGAAAVTIPAPDGLQAIFGHFEQLELLTPDARTVRVLAQDLASDQVMDIGDRIQRKSDRIVLDGELIATVGTSGESVGGRSQPGFVVKIG